MHYKTDDVNIEEIKELLPPVAVIEKYPAGEETEDLIYHTRNAVHRILHNKDTRLLVIVGPCSIHDPEAALAYAAKLEPLRRKYRDHMEILMRVYFEKPRTSIGWKGLINDPYHDNSFQINDGLRMGRKLLLDLNAMGMPCAVEYLDMISPQYIADLISWGAIGARTTESQVHRELASGLSCPVGFKNGTDGTIQTALDAIKAARSSHHFLSVTKYGHSAIVSTKGNPDCHIILRGGKDSPNYDADTIRAVRKNLTRAQLPEKIMVDLSHGNSRKDFKKQLQVGDDIARQLEGGEDAILGVM
ncbi:MAG: 3-deoxy-7-phosphoheptulonate synthase, partial [Fibrobacterota bacterium]